MLDPPLAALRYDMYFRFFGWRRHVLTYNGPIVRHAYSYAATAEHDNQGRFQPTVAQR